MTSGNLERRADRLPTTTTRSRASAGIADALPRPRSRHRDALRRLGGARRRRRAGRRCAARAATCRGRIALARAVRAPGARVRRAAQEHVLPRRAATARTSARTSATSTTSRRSTASSARSSGWSASSRVRPEVVAHDLHPDYLSTRYARDARRGARTSRVQHHHAHVASAMAEHGLDGPGDRRRLRRHRATAPTAPRGAARSSSPTLDALRARRDVPAAARSPAATAPSASRGGSRSRSLDDAFDGDAAARRLAALRRACRRARSRVVRADDRDAASTRRSRTASGRYFDAFGALGLARPTRELRGAGRDGVGAGGRRRARRDRLPVRGRHDARAVASIDLRADGARGGRRPARRRRARGDRRRASTTTLVAATADGRARGRARARRAAGRAHRRLLPERAARRGRSRARSAPSSTVYVHGEVPPGDGGIALGQARRRRRASQRSVEGGRAVCLGVPGKSDRDRRPRRRIVDFWGVRKQVRLDVVDEPVAVGDYVLNHVGFAIRRIPAEEVEATLALYEELLARRRRGRPDGRRRARRDRGRRGAGGRADDAPNALRVAPRSGARARSREALARVDGEDRPRPRLASCTSAAATSRRSRASACAPTFPEALDVIMGPGCPVCITDVPEVDEAVALALQGVRVATYGDMLRVPGHRDVARRRAGGGRARRRRLQRRAGGRARARDDARRSSSSRPASRRPPSRPRPCSSPIRRRTSPCSRRTSTSRR